MKFAAMQPYFMPYIGYYQLINAVDKFIVYDNIEFTKKGWMNRNRILVNGEPHYFTVNLEKCSDYAMVNERKISSVFIKERRKVIGKIETNYSKAPFYRETMPLVKQCFECNDKNLFEFIFFSIRKITEYLNIDTELVVSSTLPIDHSLKNKYKLWALSEYLGIQDYINPIGGINLYREDEFLQYGVNLSFHRANLREYLQVGAADFCPALSVLDVLMNLGREGTREHLTNNTLN